MYLSADDKATFETDVVAVTAKHKVLMDSRNTIKLPDHRFPNKSGFTMQTSVYLQYQPLATKDKF
jgi:hypothetical protein